MRISSIAFCEMRTSIAANEGQHAGQSLKNPPNGICGTLRVVVIPFEMLEARPLDFGHWSAHKLEAMSNFELAAR